MNDFLSSALLLAASKANGTITAENSNHKVFVSAKLYSGRLILWYLSLLSPHESKKQNLKQVGIYVFNSIRYSLGKKCVFTSTKLHTSIHHKNLHEVCMERIPQGF